MADGKYADLTFSHSAHHVYALDSTVRSYILYTVWYFSAKFVAV